MANRTWSFDKKFFINIILKGVGGVVTVFIIVFVSLFALPFVGEYFSRTKFDSDTWKAAGSWRAVESSEARPFRTQMIDDLLSKYHLVGKTRSEIEVLLGAPSESAFRDSEYFYWLGPERRKIFGIDSEWLIIKFKNNVVTETRIYTD